MIALNWGSDFFSLEDSAPKGFLNPVSRSGFLTLFYLEKKGSFTLFSLFSFSSMDSLRWGIIGTGNIAHLFAKALKVAKRGRLVAVGSRSLESAKTFGAKFGVDATRCFGSYQDLLQSEIDIVYISTPHPQHFSLALEAIEAGKHMLIEKPMGMTETQVKTIFEAAQARRLFVMEAYMYRCHPQTRKVVELIQSGVIGQVKYVRANFSFDGRPLGPSSRLWRNELGGGAILDIGGCNSFLKKNTTATV
jgi:predicted dehydrogenase